MRIRLPLWARILGWFFLNVVFLAVVFTVVVRMQFRFGLDSLLAGRAGERIQLVSELIVSELNRIPRGEWNDLLDRFGGAYQVEFALFRMDGVQLAGHPVVLPEKVRAKVMEPRGPPALARMQARASPPNPPETPARDQEGFRGPPPGPNRRGPDVLPPRPGIPGTFPKFLLRTQEPSRYWVLVHIPFTDPDRPRPIPMTLAAISNSLSAGGFFFEIKTWGAVAAGVILLSVLFWLPLIRGITRSIRQMQQATEQIAEGRFEVRVDEHRRDELGSLGQAINRMAGRLAGFVTGQKRFLGDIAHELCSPLARMQMAIGILEQRADEKQKTALDDVREEVEQMSALVNELLSFSRASLAGHHVQLKRVRLADIVDKAIRRESARSDLIECAIPADLEVQADPDLLQRAVANLLRNALRYAGEAGPITVSAMANAGGVELKVADCGPGIPPEAMDKIFDPFFRPDPSRDRQTGGVGLGLAIVKTCVEACGAQVMCRNRQPSGLEVEIHFPPDATAATGSR